MFGEKIRKLREANGLMQKEVAAELEVDTAYMSKIEKNEKPASRNHIKKLSSILHFPENELLTLWLADKVYDMVKNESVALKAVSVAEKEIKNKRRK